MLSRGLNFAIFSIVIYNFGFNYSACCEIKVDAKKPVSVFKHFWKSTGLWYIFMFLEIVQWRTQCFGPQSCHQYHLSDFINPPDPKEEIYKFLLSDEEKFNLALIGALPNQGIRQVRIHWLFNLIFLNQSNNDRDQFNFMYLDDLLDFLIGHNLKPRFELMGYPVTLNRSLLGNLNNRESIGRGFWKNLVQVIAERYIARFGANEVSSWKFELWNEPDLKNYNLLRFTLPEYLEYANGCAEGLKNAFGAESVGVALGGPAGLFREENHPLCWGLLEACDSLGKSQCPIQFISFHRKGDGTAEGVLNGTLELLDLLHNKFPNLVEMPIANDESDIIRTWSDSWEWRGDARYAAMVVKVIAAHYKSVILDRKLKIELLSNDNGFLNYHPFYFTQRTLFARFQMNLTDPPHSQFIKKPIYGVMAMLSFLGDEHLNQEINSTDPLLTVLSTRSADQSTIAILLAYADGDEVNIETIKSVKLGINNLSIGSRVVVYLLDNIRTNPYRLWQKLGAPVFPNETERLHMRQQEEPRRSHDPRNVSSNKFNIVLNLTVPSVTLIHICAKPWSNPGVVTELSVFNITRNEVLLTWNDAEIGTKCIRTYEVEFESKCANSLQFERVNANDTIFLSYHHAATGDGACETTIGRYRVRAVDYWDQPGNYSKIVSFP